MVLAATVGSGTVIGGDPTAYQFQVTPGQPCVGGEGPPDTSVTIKLRSKAGQLLDQTTDTIDDEGRFISACLDETPTPGQKLIASGSAPKHTFVVTGLTALADRVANRVTGTAPPGADLSFEVSTCRITTCTVVGTVHANDVSASYSRSLAPHDLDGTDSVQVFYRSPGGDLVYGYAHAPHMVVRQNATNEVLANTYVDQPLRVDLRSAGGVLLATAGVTSTGPGGLTSLRFRRDGAPVRSRPDDGSSRPTRPTRR